MEFSFSCKLHILAALSSLLFVLPVPVVVHGWGVDGHLTVCKIAQARLSETAAAAVKELLPADNDLGSLCSWADEVKRAGYGWSFPLHFVNTPFQVCNYDYTRIPKLSDLFPEQEGTKVNVDQLLQLGVADRSFKAFPVEFFVEVAGGETEVEVEEDLPSTLPEMSTATRSKSTVSASELVAAVKAKKVAQKDNKLPTPKSMASSSDVNVSKKKEEVKKRKLSDTEAVEGGELGMARKKLKDAIANFVDEVANIMCPIVDQLDAVKIKAARYNCEAEELRKQAATDAEEFKKQATKNAEVIEKLKKDLQAEKEELKVVKAEKAKEHEAYEKELDAAKKEFTFNATKVVFEARVGLMEEYKNGLALEWDVEAERKLLEDFVGEPVDAEEVNSAALVALVEDTDRTLSTLGVAQNGQEENATPAAAGQEV